MDRLLFKLRVSFSTYEKCGNFFSSEREFIQTRICRCNKEHGLADRHICHECRTKRCETDRDIYRDVDSREFTCLHRAKTNNDRG